MASIKECLRRLTEQNVDMKINKHVKYLIENVDENHIQYKLSQVPGIKIDGEMIQLNYYPGIGFQCRNLYEQKYGKLPLCKYVERFLNGELQKI